MCQKKKNHSGSYLIFDDHICWSRQEETPSRHQNTIHHYNYLYFPILIKKPTLNLGEDGSRNTLIGKFLVTNHFLFPQKMFHFDHVDSINHSHEQKNNFVRGETHLQQRNSLNKIMETQLKKNDDKNPLKGWLSSRSSNVTTGEAMVRRTTTTAITRHQYYHRHGNYPSPPQCSCSSSLAKSHFQIRPKLTFIATTTFLFIFPWQNPLQLSPPKLTFIITAVYFYHHRHAPLCPRRPNKRFAVELFTENTL